MASVPLLGRTAPASVLLGVLILGVSCGEPRSTGAGTGSARQSAPLDTTGRQGQASQADTTRSPGTAAQSVDLDLVEYLVRRAGIDSAQASLLLQLASQGVYSDSALVAALEPWLGAARTLDAPQRVAALVAADLVLAHWVCPIPEPDRREIDLEGCRRWHEQVSGRPVGQEELESLCGAPERPERLEAAGEETETLDLLEALGARFSVQSESGEGVEAHCLYRRNWLAEALALDSLNAFGDSARAMILLSRDVLGGGSSCGMDERWVIAEAERLLQRVTDRTLLAELHFLLGDVFDQSASYQEAEARARAIEHYRAGVALDSASSPASDVSRRTLPRLLEGRRSGPPPELQWC